MKDDDDNVIDFMKVKEARDTRTEEIEKLILESDKEIAQHFATMQAREIVFSLKEMGIDIEKNTDCILDVLCIIETIKGMIYRTAGEDHPFQLLADGVFDKIDLPKEKVMKDFIEEMNEYFDGLEE